jgi:hypothetical protein
MPSQPAGAGIPPLKACLAKLPASRPALVRVRFPPKVAAAAFDPKLTLDGPYDLCSEQKRDSEQQSPGEKARPSCECS